MITSGFENRTEEKPTLDPFRLKGIVHDFIPLSYDKRACLLSKLSQLGIALFRQKVLIVSQYVSKLSG